MSPSGKGIKEPELDHYISTVAYVNIFVERYFSTVTASDLGLLEVYKTGKALSRDTKQPSAVCILHLEVLALRT
jgi:hypothetical protein